MSTDELRALTRAHAIAWRTRLATLALLTVGPVILYANGERLGLALCLWIMTTMFLVGTLLMAWGLVELDNTPWEWRTASPSKTVQGIATLWLLMMTGCCVLMLINAAT